MPNSDGIQLTEIVSGQNHKPVDITAIDVVPGLNASVVRTIVLKLKL